jgi:hypothetical protein
MAVSVVSYTPLSSFSNLSPHQDGEVGVDMDDGSESESSELLSEDSSDEVHQPY